MDTNNSFLESYKKQTEEQAVREPEKVPSSGEEKADLTFEEKSSFVKPKRQGSGMPADSSSKNKKLLPVIIGGFILIAVIIGLFLMLNRGIEMINLVGWTENDAQLWARGNGISLQPEQEYNDTHEAGRVVSQSITEGTRVKKGDFVRLVVSLGHDLSVTLPIPDFPAMSRNEIDAWSAENFMTKVRITTEFSDTVETGKVIRFEINDDTVVDEVRRDSPVYIILSKGPEETGKTVVEIPNFKIMSIAEVYTFADENGLSLIVEEEYDDFAPQGSIVSQSVKAETEVPEGTEITLVVSKGKMITVPDFSDYPKEMAGSVAGELGIPISIEEKYSGRKAGAFLTQSIKAGTVYEHGDIVILAYSIDNRISLPSFVGSTRDALESWAKDLNSRGASITIKTTSTISNSPPGVILTQSKANTMIDTSTTISITVSKGKVVYVPDFVAPIGSGYHIAVTREKAMVICESLNIVPVFVEESKSGRLPGEIWFQSIGAGKEISEGSIITLKYAPSNVQITVPSFINMTKAEILAKNYHLTFDITFVEGEYKEGFDDKVYEQSLTAGIRTASGSAITLTTSPKQGPIIPDPTEEPGTTEEPDTGP